MPQFVLLLRDAPGSFPADASPEEMQSIIGRYREWSQRVRTAPGSQKLRDREGRVVRRDGTSLAVTDGPYAESREVLGGFFVVEADDYDQAQQLVADCPHLDYGSIEIRQIEVMPPR